MKLNQLRLEPDIAAKLSQLKARTGLTPNILCRLAFALSLNDPGVPDPADFANADPTPLEEKAVREIDRHTLMGQWDTVLVALLRERCFQDGLPLENEAWAAQFRAHIFRGVILLHKRTRTLSDLAQLLPKKVEEVSMESEK